MSITARARSALFALLLIPAVTVLAPSASHAAGLIGPGAIIFSPAGQCTQNFVFKNSSGALYVGTAGHCVTAVGNRVRFASGTEFGSVVFRRFSGVEDYSLIKIDTAFYSEVDPAMRRWGGPTGVREAFESNRGDLVLFHGYGLIYGSTGQTRPRAGVLWDNDGNTWTAEGPILFGDSGGPILDEKTGEAIGFTNWISAPPRATGGATTEAFLRALSSAGINVSIVTAPYTPIV